VTDSTTAEPKRSRKADWQLLRQYWPFIAAERRWLLGGLLAVPLTSLAGLAQPWLIKLAIDGPIADAVAKREPTTAWTVVTAALAFLGAVLLEYLFRAGQLYALQHAGYQSLGRLRRAIYRHVLRQGARFFDKRATGSLLSRTMSDVEALGEVLTFGIVGIIGDVVDILAFLAAMLWLDPKLTVVSLAVAPLLVLIVEVFRRQLRKYATDIRKSQAAASGFFQEALAGAKVVQLHGREAQTVREYKAMNYKYLDAYRLSNWYDASLYAVMDGMASISVALLIWYGAGRSLQTGPDAVSLGMLVAFIQYIQRIFVPIRELSGKVATIERALAALERVFGLLGEDESLPDGHHAPAKVRGALRLEAVDFGYGGGVPVLHQLSLSVQPGEVVALVGPTGSGKSTVAKLLTRLYEPPAGRVLVDDVPVEQWQLQALRSAIGVVQQDVVLFSGTVADNIAMGRTLSDAALTAAVDGACMTDVVARLGGLQALLSESGGNLSAGERQLLSIARILALDPPVVILDEATASIDTQTEQKVQRAMERMFAGRTALVVAHRLSTIQKADRIAVLRRGELIQLGNHQALMAQDGLYRQLVEAAAEEGRLADKIGDTSGHS